MPLVDPVSQLFLHLERSNQPMHVGGLQLFALPEDAPADYVHRLVDRMRARRTIQPPFDKRLKYRLGQPFWSTDPDLDMEHHVRHLALPEPGAIRELLALVSMLHGIPLDRSRPLWEFYIIEGVTDRRFAIYTKVHHVLMDGVSAVRILRRYLSSNADAQDLQAPWQLPPKSSPTKGHKSAGRQWLQQGYRQLTALPTAARTLYGAWQDALKDPAFTGPVQAPSTLFNRRISGARRFAAQGYSLSRVRAAASAHQATVNDVVLAMCSGALRRYLIEHDALPQAPLVGMVPLSLHDDDATVGNRLGLIYANLATDLADPVARLVTIKRSVDYWKQRFSGMSAEQVMTVVAALTAPAGLNLITGAAPRHQAFNVIISNIPGPREPLYFGDAEMLGLYPVSIAFDGQALNISLISYRDSLEFGLTACREAVPSMQSLLKYLDEALDELEDSAAPASA